MLTKLIIRNFKKFEHAEIELGNSVVFIGPNNSGKTTALQALALWEVGLRIWREKRSGKIAPKKKSGVAINRKDLVSMPVPESNLLWRDLHVRQSKKFEGGKETPNIRIDIIVQGITQGQEWEYGLEFDYANDETIYCRPLADLKKQNSEIMQRPEYLSNTRIAFLHPLSGLATNETRLDPGAINVRIGEGRTAEVIRNICYQVSEKNPDGWDHLVGKIDQLFGVVIKTPEYIKERGEISMQYIQKHPSEITLDLSAAGRGLHQTLLLLAFMYANPGAILLIDEPDAHLEFLRQQQIYQLITEVAKSQDNQIIIASHSEVVLAEAADRDMVMAFLGKPHRIDDRGSQVLKALKEIGFQHYYLAEQKGWVLYLEGSTDLAILTAFASTLDHPAQAALERPFVHYVGNQPQHARSHFYGLKEAAKNLKGIAIFDSDTSLKDEGELRELKWKRKEIENYIWSKEVLLNYARGEHSDTLFGYSESEKRMKVMNECIEDLIPRAAQRDPQDKWWIENKASVNLDRIFDLYFKKLGLPNIMLKSNYHQLAALAPVKLLDKEIADKLDAIFKTASQAKPLDESF